MVMYPALRSDDPPHRAWRCRLSLREVDNRRCSPESPPMTSPTHYSTLGVPRGADDATIKRAYRALAVKHHPDRSKAKDAAVRFAAISTAYAVLSDPAKRGAYDAELILAELERSPAPAPTRRAAAPQGGSIADDPIFVEMRDYVTRRRETMEQTFYQAPVQRPLVARQPPRWATGPIAWLLFVGVPIALLAALGRPPGLEAIPFAGWLVVAFAQLIAAGRRSPLAVTHRSIVAFFER